NSCNTTIQLSTEPQVRGRVLALYVTIQQGTTPIGAPIVGWLGSQFGARWSVLTGGFAALAGGSCAAVLTARSPTIRTQFARALRSAARPSQVEVEARADAELR